jgi:hypothetical protein
MREKPGVVLRQPFDRQRRDFPRRFDVAGRGYKDAQLLHQKSIAV